MYQNIFIHKDSEFDSTVHLWSDEGYKTYPWKKTFGYAYAYDENGQYKTMFGKSVSRVKRFEWGDSNIFESDLMKEIRVLSDLYLDSDIPSPNHKVLFFDIETDSSTGYGKAELGDKPVTAISNYDQFNDQYMVFILDPQKQIETTIIDNKLIYSCESEDKLLQAWLHFYTQLSPSILVTWNGDKYDVPYVYNRLKLLYGEPEANRLSSIGLIKFGNFTQTYQIAGVSHLDYMKVYKRFTYTQKPSYRLDAICQEEIDQGKVVYEGTLDNLYQTNLNKFIEYSFNDVQLMVNLDKKIKMIDLVIGMSCVSKVPLESYPYPQRYIEGAIVTYLHRKGIVCSNKPQGSSGHDSENDSEQFEGAFVKVPIPGLYEWVVSWDVNSEYPSCMRSINISPETKIGKVTYGWDFDKFVQGSTDEINIIVNGDKDKITFVELRQFLEIQKYNISGNGVIFTNDRRGVIPQILDIWFEERKQMKNLMIQAARAGDTEKEIFYNQMQHIKKIYLNTIFGFVGAPTSRFYDIDNAEAITVSGQKVVQSTIKYVNNEFNQAGVSERSDEWVERYWNIMKKDAKEKGKIAPLQPSNRDYCIGGDTDSAHFSLAPLLAAKGLAQVSYDEKKSFCINFARQTEDNLNQFYDIAAKRFFNCDRHYLKIASESLYETGFWLAKKRYAYKKCYDLEKSMDVSIGKSFVAKGVDVVRSSFPRAFSKFMKQLLNDILDKKDKLFIDQSILEFNKNLESLPYMDIAKTSAVKELSKYDGEYQNLTDFAKGTPYHVKAAIAYNRLLTQMGLGVRIEPIGDGAKVKLIALKKNPYDLEFLAIKGYDDPPEILTIIEEYVSHRGMYERELQNKLEDFYTALNWGPLPVVQNELTANFFDFD